MGIKNVWQNAVTTIKDTGHTIFHPVATAKGYFTDSEGNVITKPSEESMGDEDYEAAKAAYDAAAENNPYSTKNMTGKLVDKVNGKLSEWKVIAFGSDEEIINMYMKGNVPGIETADEKAAQKKADKEAYQKFLNAKDNLKTAEKEDYNNEVKYSASSDKWYKMLKDTKDAKKTNGKDGLQGTTADDGFSFF